MQPSREKILLILSEASNPLERKCYWNNHTESRCQTENTFEIISDKVIQTKILMEMMSDKYCQLENGEEEGEHNVDIWQDILYSLW